MAAALPFEPRLVRERLQARILELLARLGFRDKLDAVGRMWPLNPMRADRRSGSFVIWTRGEGAGAWKDYAAPDFHGDVFDLIRETQKLASWRDAYWWALDFLGLDRRAVRTLDQAQADRQRAALDRAVAERKALEADSEASRALFGRWLAMPTIIGTLAETYLREARGIPLDRLAHFPGALRFAAALQHVDDETGEVTHWPAMVAAMTRGTRIAGLHRTWLARDGSGKAPVSRPKMMLGPVRGAAIRLAPGPTGLSPSAAAAAGVASDRLALGEGIETCLTIAAAWPRFRVWAAGSLSLMGCLDWPACVRDVTLLRDNDWHSADARRAFDVVEAHWRALGDEAGGDVFVRSSPVGSDFNDAVRVA
jgi:hypothetical protein